MRPRAGRVAPLLLALWATSGALHAQAVTSVGPIVSYSPAGASARTAVGVSADVTTGLLGLRASGTVGLADGGGGAFEGGGRSVLADGWTADADLLLHLGPSGGTTLRPYAFAGVGVAPWAAGVLDGGPRQLASWSYGGGVRLPLVPALEVTAEARQRLALRRDPLDGSDGRGRTELRAGLALRFGGRSARATPARRGPVPSREPAARRPAPAGRTGSVGTARSAAAARLLSTGERYLGVPYRWGGTTPAGGFDCSGFVQFVFARHDVRLPRTSWLQARAGEPLDARWDRVAAGDLVMFAEPGERVSHVAIYAGDGRILHSSGSGGGVRYDDLGTERGRWYRERMVAARRVTPDGAGLVRDLLRGFTARELASPALDPPDRAPRPDPRR